MKCLFDAGATVFIIVCLLAIGGSLAHKFSNKEHWTGEEKYKGHDQQVEEFIEEVHGVLTGTKVDFTPESPEQ